MRDDSSLLLNAAPRSTASSRYFQARTIDGAPELLEQSYALRYQVYCLERKFLNADDYPAHLEFDEFDPHSIHVGAFDAAGVLAGTARVIKMSALGFPVLSRCSLFPHDARSTAGMPVEIGRLSVSRNYNRRSGERRDGCGDVFLTLLKGLYQATKRLGATHWLAATERSLLRMLVQQGFPARLIGPESDYFGLVSPYRMDLREFDDVILSNRFPALQDFVIGLEPELRPDYRTPGPGETVAMDRSGFRINLGEEVQT